MIKMDEEGLPGSTWNKTDETEPVFVLVARDKLAPAIVRCWAFLAKVVGVNNRKRQDALHLAVEMERWQAEHGAKTPD